MSHIACFIQDTMIVWELTWALLDDQDKMLK